MGIQQTSCVVKSNSTDVLTQYVWISNQYVNTKNEKHDGGGGDDDDDDDDNEDDGNDDRMHHQQSFRHSSVC